MDITRTYLANRYGQFGVTERKISYWVAHGVLPRARVGRHASYPPEIIPRIEELLTERERRATLAELAERRQLTGQLLPPTLDRGPV